MSSFHIINFGCRATQADGGEIEREMLARSFQKSDSVVSAEVVVLNTCTVTAAADRDARQTIRRLRRENPDARIVVTGCYAQRASDEIRQIPGVDFVIGNSHKQYVARILEERLSSPRAAHFQSSSDDGREPINSLSCAAEVYLDAFSRMERTAFPAHAFFGATERTRPSLKVQDGCDANCSFCIIPAVRGRSRSLSPEDVLKQVSALAAEGYREVVLSGIHLGSYGRDLAERTSFYELMRRLSAIEGCPRLRLSSIEPLEVSHEIIDCVADSPHFAKHFHVPLQSGDDRILRLMRRPYTSSQYAAIVEKIRRKIPGAAIGADVIAGFPGETDAEHAATLNFIERSPLTYLHVFSFSARPGTTAATLRGALSPVVIKKRSAALRELGSRKKFKFQRAMMGKILPVITLDRRREGYIEGMSDNFLEVQIADERLAPNRRVAVLIEGIESGELAGSVVDGPAELKRPSFSTQAAPLV